MLNACIAHACAEKPRDTTLHDEKYDVTETGDVQWAKI